MIEEKTTSESIKELIEFMNTIQKEKGNMDYWKGNIWSGL